MSFIVPTLNEVSMLARLLESISGLRQTDNLYVNEVIVVDADSDDGTAMLAKQNGCRVISAKPGNVAASRNLGAAQATGSILAFVDADCELPPNWLTDIARELEIDEVVAAGASMALNPENPTWVECAWFELAHRQEASAESRPVKWLATFNLAVKREAFLRTGGFDESLITCEDVEFGYRLTELGGMRRIGSSGVIHYGESKSVVEFVRREAWRARGSVEIFSKHWKNPREFLSFLLPFFVVAGLLAGAMLVVISLIPPFHDLSNRLLLASVALGLIPILLLTLRRTTRWRLFWPCYWLMTLYFIARFVGSLRSFRRVERNGFRQCG